MQFSSLSSILLLAASALVSADVENEDHHGGGGKSWVEKFDNLVAFGDSYEARPPFINNF
jgi:hypothetical protein